MRAGVARGHGGARADWAKRLWVRACDFGLKNQGKPITRLDFGQRALIGQNESSITNQMS